MTVKFQIPGYKCIFNVGIFRIRPIEITLVMCSIFNIPFLVDHEKRVLARLVKYLNPV